MHPKSNALFSCVAVLSMLWVLAGCEDPTKNKPAAVVSESGPAATDATPAADGRTLAFTSNTSVGFVGSKVTGSHDGGFNSVTGSVSIVGDDLTQTRIDATIDMNSTWADNERLTNHLKSPDFFDVENHPEAKFVSTAIEKSGEGYSISGALTLHGVTKNISFPASLSLENGTLKATAEFSINRMDFNIVYPGKAEDLIRENVLIKLNIEAA